MSNAIMPNAIIAPPAPAPAAAGNDAQQSGPGFDAALQKAAQSADKPVDREAGGDRAPSAPQPAKTAGSAADKPAAAGQADKTAHAGDAPGDGAAQAEPDAAWLAQWAAYMPPAQAQADAQGQQNPAAADTDGSDGVAAAAGFAAAARTAGTPAAAASPAAASVAVAGAGAAQLAAQDDADEAAPLPPAGTQQQALAARAKDNDEAGGRGGQSSAGDDRGQAFAARLQAESRGANAAHAADQAPALDAQTVPSIHGPQGAASATPAVAAATAIHGTAASAAPPTVPGAPAPLHNPALQSRIDEALRWMAGDGLQTAQLRVTPDALGPITIHLRLDGDVANVVFGSNHAQTREALESSFAGLKDALASGGLSLGQTSVGSEQQSGLLAQQQQAGDGHGQRLAAGRGAMRGAADDPTAGAQTSAAPAAARPRNPDRMLDMYA